MSPDEIDAAVKTYIFIDFDVASLGDDIVNVHGLTLFNLSETLSKTFNHPCMASKLLSYHRWRHISL